MKKTYINPTTEIININASQLLAGSEIPTGGNGSANDAESREIEDLVNLMGE